MSVLLDAQPPKPPSRKKKYAIGIGLLVVILSALTYARFRNYAEEQAVRRFLMTLQQGNYEEAYRLWQPSPSYTFHDFVRDWGEQGDYGRIRQFEILKSKSRGSNSVVVTVRINNVNPPLDLVVDRETKGLAYSPF